MSESKSEPKIGSRFFAVKTTGGQERNVANHAYTILLRRQKPIYSILVLEGMKGYVLFEATNAQVVTETVMGFKHVKSTVQGMMLFSDIERFLVSKPVIAELSVNDIVEIVAGPFKGMRARIDRLEVARGEATIVLLDTPYQLPVTVDANYLKIVKKTEGGG